MLSERITRLESHANSLAIDGRDIHFFAFAGCSDYARLVAGFSVGRDTLWESSD